MSMSRSCNVSPGAASGGCPSSVRALRTAEQYLRIIVALSSFCFSIARSIGRTPRTCFFNSFGVLAICLIDRFRCFS
jgi:hypothetical protein